MRQSSTLIPTLREVPADADIKSHQLLLRAGYMRQNASGVYSFLPLGKRVLQKVEQIVREEMDRAGSVELLMPALQQAELWQESGRWYSYGPELMRMKDRHGREFALGATHEEVITSLLRDEVKSYKRLPLNLYQIQTKFRDEKRPRFGLLRGREFIMKDAYSFHASQESLDEVYDKMFAAYSRIFERCGLNFRAVIADSGAMGGKDTHEFMVLSEIGEDTIAYSDTSSYAANVEMAPVVNTYEKSGEAEKELTKVETPNQHSIEDVAAFLNVEATSCIKSLLFKVDDRFVLVLVRGDHEVNDIKVKNYFEASVVELATPEETKEVLKCAVGSVGPIGVSDSVEVVADHAVKAIANGVCGANEEGYHYTNVNERNFNATYEDFRFIQEGDQSPDGQGVIKFAKGIEVGHVFKLGTRYSEAMGATYLDENGRNQPMIMGCYGIGVSRTVAAIAEQFNDENGLLWPEAVTPYQVHVIPVNVKNDEQRELGEKLYNELLDNRFEVLLDDRQERAGVKFADSDLIGLPVRVTVGKRASEGIVEVKVRKTGESLEVSVDNLVSTVKELLAK
ncbi:MULTISPECIES: proline--tRNA ligase [Priestia]|jgi:prolyl-tRNA synthetase|uniref:Proline--tRNA ligase n=3 Tax=Priestia TaxID=2800373 RepID=D5DQK4_PRIM1|nr:MULTISPECIES: proline--tRNA ligase [Priestia]AVX10050.1 proline--tRNA ligase [Bacillus sp. Y-01]KOP76145.1 prolyl-tRNA synthetase [Bacillus sp. FJAT-21351]KQU22975.1 proline--tRNA ligase [Bacillus sp. Leaf75]MBZ5478343.1 proline--tRNA ligase [Bacillus sp. T_4]MCF6798035.1 proline--tRNA ligase [Bacillus sp. ET1]MCJ7984784.1 proline--tRNA ligase [Priestia sp. OVL9]MDP9577071.1 prolyl-tRNA synthetase [Bacillus sp. 1751]MEB2272863.1 proline--tRNA ligase [Bacillus sp. ILBB4]RFB25731.1 prolin